MFLKNNLNKTELNVYLAETLSAMTYLEGRQLFITNKEKVLSNCGVAMGDCDHEEADTRMIIHIKHALSLGMTTIQVLSSDTDVIIILLGVYFKLRNDHSFTDIVIEFSQKKYHRRINITNLASSLGQSRCHALIFFHSFTG